MACKIYGFAKLSCTGGGEKRYVCRYNRHVFVLQHPFAPVLPTVQTNTSLPSFSSMCMVYPEESGGVFNSNGFSFVPILFFMRAIF
jgi:hypothetical protein